jgi:hypothetical protein
MSEPIHVLFLGKATEAWYQLSQEEQESLMAKVGPSPEKAGGKNILGCNSSWSSEQWQFFGVHEFPNIEAVQKHSELLNELNWRRYVDSMTVLGTKWPST